MSFPANRPGRCPSCGASLSSDGGSHLLCIACAFRIALEAPEEAGAAEPTGAAELSATDENESKSRDRTRGDSRERQEKGPMERDDPPGEKTDSKTGGRPGPGDALSGDDVTQDLGTGPASQRTAAGARTRSLETPQRPQVPGAKENPGASAISSWSHLDLLDKLGEGGFGETFRARDTRLERDVALKLLKVDASRQPEIAGRVIREGALLARIRHPNVVTVHGAEQRGDSIGIWMEYIHGSTLETFLEEQGRLGERESVLIGVDLCGALAAVHGAGIVHRDIKTANVMREEGGRIVLMDFGLGVDIEASVRGSGTLAGTPHSMAPELFAGEPATVRSDIFGLGVLLYRLVSGRYPWTGRTLPELIDAIRSRPAIRLRDSRPDLSVGFVRVVERCLAADPRARFATAGDLESALMDVLGASGPIAREGGGVPAEARPARRAGNIEAWRKARIAEWSQPRYRLDKEFVSLTLLVDQGEESASGRWGARTGRHGGLREVLATVTDPALVLLGSPGCGKSTLLRQLELEIAQEALARQDPHAHPVTFFIQLNSYKTVRTGEPPPEPKEWLSERWAARFSDVPPLPDLLAAGRMIFLLDGLNEMAAAGPGGPRQAVARWKDFLDRLVAENPGNRLVFSCRSLDYSAPLSTASLRVPQLVIEPMTDAQVEQCLLKQDPVRGAELWSQLRGTPQLEAMRSPYFLSLLVDQAASSAGIPRGRASLFTGFVRRALLREVERDHPLFVPNGLLTDRDVRRIASGKWGSPWSLPEHGALIPKLVHLAYDMQAQSADGGSSQVRVDYDEALRMIDHDRDDDIVRAGEALSVLDEDSARGEVKFFHQLVQEYFAGRRLGAKPEPERVAAPWSVASVAPPLAEVLRRLPPGETLPPLTTTGWEETTLYAAAMSDDPDGFVRGVMETNLPLAGRCASQPEVLPRLSAGLVEPLRRALMERSRDPGADLRSRIEAGLALGPLDDPRFERRKGPQGDYLLPPMIDVAGGTYPLGEDEPFESLGDRSTAHIPSHDLSLPAFRIGRFPVTNAEWAFFLRSGGYEDERWWDTESALRWQRGEGTAEGTRSQVRYWVARFRKNPEELEERWAARDLTEEAYERWKLRLAMTEDELESHLKDLFPGGILREPLFWRDPTWNSPLQPVVGIGWFEARAYTLWLAAQSGERFRLPSEAEWEAAARGREGRLYAFGKEFDPLRANTAGTRIRRTSPVGVFVEGDTPEGVSDLTGNVEEWTASLFGAGGPDDAPSFRYPYRPDDGREDASAGAEVRRVVRGGAWPTPMNVARAASRVDSPPDYRFNHTGFRVAASVA